LALNISLKYNWLLYEKTNTLILAEPCLISGLSYLSLLWLKYFDLVRDFLALNIKSICDLFKTVYGGRC